MQATAGNGESMTTVAGIVQKRPVLTYFALTFAVSWSLFLAIGGHDLFSGIEWDSSTAFGFAIIAMLTGPTVASLVLTRYLSGRAGLRELFRRTVKWRVSIHWYAVALLTAPLVAIPVLLALWAASPEFEPPILTEDASGVAVLAAAGVGFTTLLEELGWTGFAIPRLRLRYSVFRTGLIVGAIWGVWHLLQIIWVGHSTPEDVPLVLYLPLYFGFGVASLTAYRILMVWVYDHTGSLLVATLMHASYAACTLQLNLLVPDLTGADLLVHGWAYAAALWVVVGTVTVISAPRPEIPATSGEAGGLRSRHPSAR